MSKIAKIEFQAQTVALNSPFTIALGTITEADTIFVKVTTDDGIIGVGEAAPETFVTGETLQSCQGALELLSEKLIGENPLHIAKIHAIMNRAMLGNGAAKTAIDIACYDIMGKIAGLPLYQLLGGYQDHVHTDMTVSIDTPAVMASEAKKWVDQGFQAIKIKVGVDPVEDIQRIQAIREAVGPSIKLRVDANQGWTPKDAIRAINRMSAYDIEFIEQPVAAKNIDGLKFVRDQVVDKIMSDESAFIPQDAFMLAKRDCVDYVNIKLMKCGGIYPALKIISLCESAGIGCMIGCMSGESNISVAAATHLAAAQPNIQFADLDATFSLKELAYEGIVGTKATPMIDLSNSQPGLGIQL
ncbi:dipeptide epimerase [Enterococcus saccharolyticus]|uniref:dipeptide epimerase n=1 Tax=Enterococcus saccharolyticus TaxID=41997 RepID=UPI001E4ADA0B|nr:dipeptide epimerase [Enterococcus saccharolyticus]